MSASSPSSKGGNDDVVELRGSSPDKSVAFDKNVLLTLGQDEINKRIATLRGSGVTLPTDSSSATGGSNFAIPSTPSTSAQKSRPTPKPFVGSTPGSATGSGRDSPASEASTKFKSRKAINTPTAKINDGSPASQASIKSKSRNEKNKAPTVEIDDDSADEGGLSDWDDLEALVYWAGLDNYSINVDTGQEMILTGKLPKGIKNTDLFEEFANEKGKFVPKSVLEINIKAGTLLEGASLIRFQKTRFWSLHNVPEEPPYPARPGSVGLRSVRSDASMGSGLSNLSGRGGHG